MDIRELITLSKLSGPEDADLFERFRRQAFEEAASTFSDRAISYNVDHSPTEEMPYGIVSLASEVYKRTIRMTSLTSPMRVEEVRPEDIARLEDTCIDVINYASWMFALVKIIQSKLRPEEPLLDRFIQSIHSLEELREKMDTPGPVLVAGGRIPPTGERWITDHEYRRDENDTHGSMHCTYFEDSSPGGQVCGRKREEHAE